MEALAEGGVSVKQVKLKVLYTFDSEHKNNHLARWPQSIEIQTAPIDDATVIGIINLRTCLEAVTSSSPELTSNLDNDYTVYAYDYSEPDTPLVGQGMLSRALSQDAEDMDNEAMVTGRITKNVMGLFSKNAQETLEVKLRFTPVAASFTRKRSGSVSSNSDNPQQQWNSLAQSNGAFRPSSPIDTSGLETMQRMLSEGGPKSGNFQKDSFYNPNSRPTSRAGTPTQSMQQNSGAGRQSLSQIRSSSQSGSTYQHGRRDSFNSGYYSGEETIDEGPRKRAKIQRVEWPSKSNLNIERQSDSLRVTASTASSLRLHRPVPQYPGIAALHSGSLEEPTRPPTPIPGEKAKKPRGRPRKVISPNLLRGPLARQSSPATRIHESVEVSLSSPEDNRGDSVTSTPADLPSSPPVMPENQNLVTSPALPPLVNETDSGFMSGTLEDLFDDQILDFGDFLQDKPGEPNQHQFEIHPDIILDDGHAVNFDLSNFDQTDLEMPPPGDRPGRNGHGSLTRTMSLGANHFSNEAASRLAPVSAAGNGSRSQTALPQIPASDPVGRTFRRSNTWAPDMSDSIMSDIGPQADESNKNRPKKRVGKEQTKARLENAIASGEMPPFCDNCGAIETPAWRRAFIKVFDTPYDDFQTSLEPGECCYKEPVERNTDGSVKLWKGYRTEKRPDEKSAEVGGWTQICLCNPCGLWFHKSKYPRPPEKWQKRDPNEKRKRKRRPKPKKKPSKPMRNDAPTPASEDSSPDDTTNEDNGEDYGDDTNEDGNEDAEPQLPPMPQTRAGSAEPAARGLGFHNMRKAKCGRQVQSSPVRCPRPALRQVHQTPNTVRRQLFPSPDSLRNKAQAVAALTSPTRDIQIPAFVRRSPRLNKIRDVLADGLQPMAMLTADNTEKENVAPLSEHVFDADDLFGMGEEEMMLPPMTPTPKRRSERLSSKTPGKTPSREFGARLDHNVQPSSPTFKTPKHKMHPAASILLNTSQRNLNPSEMTPFTRSIHDALNHAMPLDLPATPGPAGSSRLRKTPRKSAEVSNVFDFPDLPSLKGSSPMHGNSNFDLNFSELTTDQLHTDYNNMFSTDAPMPSSPPAGYFNFIDINGDGMDDLWDDLTLQGNKHGEHESVDIAANDDSEQHIPVRRSPRKHTA